MGEWIESLPECHHPHPGSVLGEVEAIDEEFDEPHTEIKCVVEISDGPRRIDDKNNVLADIASWGKTTEGNSN